MTKILVTVKRIPDPDESLKFAKQGGLDLSSVKWVPNAFDEYAVETALRLAEDIANKKKKLAEIIVLSICPQKQRQHMTQFLAMGADRAIRFHAAAIGFNPYADVVVHHALDADQYFHGVSLD